MGRGEGGKGKEGINKREGRRVKERKGRRKRRRKGGGHCILLYSMKQL